MTIDRKQNKNGHLYFAVEYGRPNSILLYMGEILQILWKARLSADS